MKEKEPEDEVKNIEDEWALTPQLQQG